MDEFFGEVETYRGEVEAILPGTGGGTVTLQVKYQGCADLGICYPPQTRKLTVALPSAGGAGLLRRVAPPSLLGNDDEPLPEAQAFAFDAIARDANTLLLRFVPAPGYYLYRDRTSVQLGGPAADATGMVAGALQWPPGTPHEDEFFGRTTVYFEPVEVALPLRRARAGGGDLQVTVSFQGCQDEGICYPPMTRTVAVPLPEGVAAPVSRPEPSPPAAPVGATSVATEDRTGVESIAASESQVAADAAPTGTAATAPQAEDQRLAAKLEGESRGVALLLFLGAGLLLAFTPCVLPMIPILSGLIAGASAAHGGRLGTGRSLALSGVYVLANALVFTAAGVVAGLLGANLQVAFQHPWVIAAFAALFVALALSMFGLYELQLPARLRARLGAVADQQRGGSWPGVAAMGALSALIVGPCVAPPLAAAVLYIGQTRDPVFGGAALFALAIGMGLPLLAFGVAAGRGLPTSGPWMTAVQRVFGFVFLGLAVWMLSRILPGPATLVLWGLLALGAAAWVLGLAKPDAVARTPLLARFAALALLVVGAAQLIGAWTGGNDPLRPLAAFTGEPVRKLEFRMIKSVEDLDREVAAAGGARRPAAAVRLLCRLVRGLQGDGEVHVHRGRGAPVARRLGTAQGRRHRERRGGPGADAPLRHRGSARHAVLRRRRRAPRPAPVRIRGWRCLRCARPPRGGRRLMRGTTRVLLVAVAAGGLGVVAALAVRGPGPLLGTEVGQRAVQEVLSATAPDVPAGVQVAQRGDVVAPIVLEALAGGQAWVPDPAVARPTLVNVWASWCGPCIEEMPELERYHVEQGANGVQVVGIALDDRTAVEAFLRRIPVGYPILLDAPGPADAGVRLGNPTGVLPYTALLDAEGRLVRQKIGPFAPGEIESWVGDP